jgi:RHS repeat-associated protein
VWDAWNRLVEVKDENGTSVQKNAFDGLSRRITKEASSVVTHTYWSDRWKPLEERTGSATTASRSYLWGERPGHRDELVLRDRDTNGDGSLDERLYATMDYFNGTAVLNTSGAAQERYAYSAFGVRRIMAADFSPRASSNFAWDFGFQGQFRDGETGWYNYGYRFYVPLLGRWINRDPIGEQGGVNLYNFSRNSPISLIDFLGLDAYDAKLGPLAGFQNVNSNCAGLAVRPNETQAPGNPKTFFHPEPDAMDAFGCRSVSGPDECEKEPPQCERHVIIYVPEGEDWLSGVPNYHAIGQIGCGTGYYHQPGTGQPVRGPFDDYHNKATNFYDQLHRDKNQGRSKDEYELIPSHYCCPEFL